MNVRNTPPICFDLFCGLGGWAEGFLSEGYQVIGFDIERHDYGTGGYPGVLVLQDIRTLHGSQLKDATVIVGSSPCQKYSYMAMPWKRAKQMAAEYRSGVRSVEELNELFLTQFRLQREAIEAAGRYIPLIVENVRGAIPWVGQSRWHYGSFHLWGDVPALMPITKRLRLKGGDRNKNRADGHAWTNSFADTLGVKAPGMNWSDQSKRGQDFTRVAAAGGYKREEIPNRQNELSVLACVHSEAEQDLLLSDVSRRNRSNAVDFRGELGLKSEGNSPQLWKDREGGHFDGSYGLKLPGNNAPRRWEDRGVRLGDAQKTTAHANIRDGFSHTRHLTNQAESDGVKFSQSGEAWLDGKPRDKMLGDKGPAAFGSKSNSRKAASAQIAKIPFPLARWIARCFKPEGGALSIQPRSLLTEASANG